MPSLLSGRYSAVKVRKILYVTKGMPIEQVQVLLGHSKIETTLCYAMVDQQNVKRSHHKYIG